MQFKLKSGFTLIELLVVIAIIAILAAILFPVFAQAREKARQITCLSNEKQIGLGILQYVQDFDETFPRQKFYDGKNASTWATWQTVINPYMKSHDVYRCPDNLFNKTFIAGGAGTIDYPISYAPNSAMMSDWGAKFDTRLPVIDSPADTVLVVESRSPWSALSANSIIWDSAQSEWKGGFYPAGAPEPGPNDGDAFEHNHFINVLFSDGHAKPTKFAHTISPKDMWMTAYECQADGGTGWYCGWGDNQAFFDWAANNQIMPEYR
jgi:prepilin-type N-terminal cleavage/methylation domain-containing protein/prepilin-type processing-associated H-X9-DG protein